MNEEPLGSGISWYKPIFVMGRLTIRGPLRGLFSKLVPMAYFRIVPLEVEEKCSTDDRTCIFRL